MMKVLITTCAICFVLAGTASADVTVYNNDWSGWQSAVGAYQTEDFTDATLNPGLSVVSDNGYVDTSTGVWWDRLEVSSPHTTTTWQFATPQLAYGGNWNTAGPGGPGAGIAVEINGSWTSVGEISRNSAGAFWGFVSTDPFTAVLLQSGSGSGWCETYEMDNMVYSVVPVPGAVLLGILGLGAVGVRLRKYA
jgi:hypothetical protein